MRLNAVPIDKEAMFFRTAPFFLFPLQLLVRTRLKGLLPWLLGLSLLIGACTPNLASLVSSGPHWPHDISDLPEDPTVTFGVLPNGFRYVLKQNNEPENNISMRMLFEVGSLMETEQQRGFAHFLEHMAFNGTTNFPAGEMVQYFQRLGMDFGADTNANTGYDRTIYYLELPTNEPPVVIDSLQLLHDYAQGVLFEPAEMEQERQIINSELRSRNSVEFRTFHANLDFMLPNSRLSRRPIGGNPQIISQASRQDLLNFYRTWYRPERMTLIVVGHFSLDAMEQGIRRFFGDLQAIPTPENPPLDTFQGKPLEAYLHPEPDSEVTQVAIQTAHPIEVDSRAHRKTRLLLHLAHMVLTGRLESEAQRQDSATLEGRAEYYSYLDAINVSELRLAGSPQDWQALLQTAEQELRRGLLHGFFPSELDGQKALLLNAFEDYAKSANSRSSTQLADQIVEALDHGEVFMEPSEELNLVREALTEATPQRVHAVFQQFWEEAPVKVFVTGNIPSVHDETAILETYRQSQLVAVKAPQIRKAVRFAYTDFGPPGEVVEWQEHEDLKLTQVRYRNNVRLNLKQMGTNYVLVNVRFGSGLLSAPLDKPGLIPFTARTLVLGGLQKHPYEDLVNIFSGKTVEANFAVGEDAFVWEAETSTRSLQNQLQILCAYMVDAAYRPESARSTRKAVEPLYKHLEHSLNGIIENQITRFLRGNDSRFGFPEKPEFLKRNLQEMQSWLEKPLRDSYLEITLVGDFEKEEAIQLVGETFGALPKRAAIKPPMTAQRQLEFPQGVPKKVFQYSTQTPQGFAMIVWPTVDTTDMRRVYQLNVLAAILQDRIRVKIREDLGKIYEYYVANQSSLTFTDFGMLGALTTVDPQDVDTVTTLMEQIGQDLHDEGAKPDEFERAFTPQIADLRNHQSNANWWLTFLAGSQENPRQLEWLREISRDYQSIQLEEVNALAQQYLGADRSVKVMVVPK